MRSVAHRAPTLLTTALLSSAVCPGLGAQILTGVDVFKAAPAQAALTGRWSGTAREKLPSGEASFPIQLAFAGTDAELRLDVSGKAQVEDDDGQKRTVLIAATYAGSCRAGEVSMKSEKIQVRIVELDQVLPSGPQTLTGKVQDGVFRGRVGSDDEGWTTFEARPERKEPAPEPVRRDKAASAYPTLVLEKREILDSGMANIASHTLLVPKGWTFTGGVQWTADPDNFVHFVGALRSEKDESLHFDFHRKFSFSSTPDPRTGPIAPGTQQLDGSTFQPPPRQPGDPAAVVVSKIHPGATQVRIVDAQRMPDVEAKQRAALAPVLKMLEESSERLRNTGGPLRAEPRNWLVAERVRVQYEEDGRSWEEEVRYVTVGFLMTLRSEHMTTESGTWTLADVQTVRAPAGRLDAVLPTMWSLAATRRETPRWSAALAEIKRGLAEARAASAKITLEQIAERGRQLAKSRAELSEMQMSGWRKDQESRDAIHKANIQALCEVQDFRDSDGQTHSVTNHYDRAFREVGGGIILTSDPNYRPQADPGVNRKTWEEMQRIDPLPSGGGR